MLRSPWRGTHANDAVVGSNCRHHVIVAHSDIDCQSVRLRNFAFAFAFNYMPSLNASYFYKESLKQNGFARRIVKSADRLAFFKTLKFGTLSLTKCRAASSQINWASHVLLKKDRKFLTKVYNCVHCFTVTISVATTGKLHHSLEGRKPPQCSSDRDRRIRQSRTADHWAPPPRLATDVSSCSPPPATCWGSDRSAPPWRWSRRSTWDRPRRRSHRPRRGSSAVVHGRSAAEAVAPAGGDSRELRPAGRGRWGCSGPQAPEEVKSFKLKHEKTFN